MDHITGARAATVSPEHPVVHVISDAGPHPYFRTLIEAGGVERSSVIVGCVGPPGPLQEEMGELGVRSFALGAVRRADDPLAAIRLARLLRGWRASVVQTHLVDGSLVGLAAARLALVPVAVFTAHHSHELPFHGWRLVAADRLCAAILADHVIAPSREVAETLVRLAHVAPQRTAVVHHGFDLDRFDPARSDRSAARRRLGVDGRIVFGAIGRIYRLKNQLALVEAFAESLRDTPDARLVIAGPGDAEAIRRRAQELGITGRLVIPGPSDDVPGLLSAFDVFVHPAIAESFGMVIVEAMAAAKPIVASPVGIAPEIVETGVNGVLAASPAMADLVDALRAVCELRPHWDELGAAARRRVAGFTAERMATRQAELHAEWLAAGAGRRQRRACSATWRA